MGRKQREEGRRCWETLSCSSDLGGESVIFQGWESGGEGWSPAGRGNLRPAQQMQKKKEQKLEESSISSQKCLSQETGEALGPVSHGERPKKQSWLTERTTGTEQ